MVPSNLNRLFLCLLGLSLIGCGNEGQLEVDLIAEGQAIRNLDAGLSAAAQARDAEAFGSFFAEDAVQLPPGSPPLDGRIAIQESAGGLLGAGADLRFETETVEVAAAGDMAFSRGKWFLSIETPGGLIEDEGSYIEVWKKVAGEWAITMDIFNSDLPDG